MATSHWEKDTLVSETHRHHVGHGIRVTERIRIDGGDGSFTNTR